MTYRVRIESDPTRDGIRVWLVEVLNLDGMPIRSVIDPSTGDHTDLPPAGQAATWTDLPSISLDDTAGMVLLDELARHYAKATDSGVTRDLLDRERARVDTLIGTLTRTLEQAMSPPVTVDYHAGEQPPTVTPRTWPRYVFPDTSEDGRGMGEWSGRAGG